MSVKTGTSEPIPPPPTEVKGITITKVPSQVKIYHPYEVAGIAGKELIGKTVELYLDNLSRPATTTKVNENGQWLLRGVFVAVANPQTRRLRVVAENATDLTSLTLTPYIERHPGAKKLTLSSSVGAGGRNLANDVRQVRERLAALGYTFAGASAQKLIEAIRLFQAIIQGRTQIRGVDGRVDAGGQTHRFLEAANAPQWMRMPARGIGFYNVEVVEQTNDNHDYGLDWMSNVIKAAGLHYELAYRKKRPGSALMVINDVSVPEGGDTPDHATHETGNAADIVLPHLNGNFGGIKWSSQGTYDRAATRAIIQALRAQPWVNKGTLYFNDPVLVAEGLCKSIPQHDGHIHFEITVPPQV